MGVGAPAHGCLGMRGMLVEGKMIDGVVFIGGMVFMRHSDDDQAQASTVMRANTGR
jgi:hypothetical protein